MEELSKELQLRIDQLLFEGELVRKMLDPSQPVDMYIIERPCYYNQESKLMKELGVDHLSEDSHNNCLIDTYLDLVKAGRIKHPPKRLL